MKNDRITFVGNPWPEGHPINTFQWTAEIRGRIVWFHFHLETEDCYSEREADDPGEDAGDRASPVVWGNFHGCKLSSTHWPDGGVPVCSMEQLSAEYIDGLEVRVDEPPIDKTHVCRGA